LGSHIGVIILNDSNNMAFCDKLPLRKNQPHKIIAAKSHNSDALVRNLTQTGFARLWIFNGHKSDAIV